MKRASTMSFFCCFLSFLNRGSVRIRANRASGIVNTFKSQTRANTPRLDTRTRRVMATYYGHPHETPLSPAMSPTGVSRRGGRKQSQRRARSDSIRSSEHDDALKKIRTFLKGRSTYDVFPLSFRLLVLDTKLEVKKALASLVQNGSSFLYLGLDRRAKSPIEYRCRICTALQSGHMEIRGDVHVARHYSPHPVLLPHFIIRRRSRRCRTLQARVPERSESHP